MANIMTGQWVCLGAVAASALTLLQVPIASGAERSVVDFRYSPPEWQTAICLPDDPHKTLVDRSGELLYHYDGLNPPGEIDGGLSGDGTGFKRPEFSNVHWNLLGLHAFIQAAHWLEQPDTAARWQKEYDDLYATFRQAAARDTCQDGKGNAYVPIFMANAGQELPQRAQWTFCHAVYPGQIFAPDDPLVASTMAMLEATEREGMVYGTGWAATGIWNYFASFYGHAWLWQGNGRKAAQVLYAYANHASPTGVWREEQSLKGEPFKKVGDMPHNCKGVVVHLPDGTTRRMAAPQGGTLTFPVGTR